MPSLSGTRHPKKYDVMQQQNTRNAFSYAFPLVPCGMLMD
jgi:hypothetical protein